MKENVIGMAGLIVVILGVLLIMQVIWVRRVRRVRTVNVVQRLIWVKHGFVLMIVDHHPTDDAVTSGPKHLTCVHPGHLLLLLGNHCTAGCRRRGRKLWDGGKGAPDVIS